MLKMATPTQQTFIVDQHKQLVDLNKDLVNFNLNFKVASTSGAPFQAVVATQRQLDNNMNLQYKNSNPDGTLSGNIVADKNIRNNYILVLKAEQQCEVVVNIDCKPIQANPANMQAQQNGGNMQPQQQQNGGNMPPQQQQNGGNMPPQRQMMPSQGGGQRFAPQQPNGGGMHSHSHEGYPHGDGSEKSTSNWKYIVTAVVILGGGALLYYFYKKKSTTEQKGGVEDVIKPVVISSPAAENLVPAEVEASSTGGGPEFSKGSSLLSRLQGLNLDN